MERYGNKNKSRILGGLNVRGEKSTSFMLAFSDLNKTIMKRLEGRGRNPWKIFRRASNTENLDISTRNVESCEACEGNLLELSEDSLPISPINGSCCTSFAMKRYISNKRFDIDFIIRSTREIINKIENNSITFDKRLTLTIFHPEDLTKTVSILSASSNEFLGAILKSTILEFLEKKANRSAWGLDDDYPWDLLKTDNSQERSFDYRILKRCYAELAESSFGVSDSVFFNHADDF